MSVGLVGNPAHAKKRFADQGVVELAGLVSFSRTSAAGNNEVNLAIAPELGYFLIDGLEISLRPQFGFSDFEANGIDFDATKAFSLIAVPSYNFDTGSAVFPYFGANLGFEAIWPQDELALALGGEGGVKVQLGNSALLRVSAQYLARFYDTTVTDIRLVGGFATFF